MEIDYTVTLRFDPEPAEDEPTPSPADLKRVIEEMLMRDRWITGRRHIEVTVEEG